MKFTKFFIITVVLVICFLYPISLVKSQTADKLLHRLYVEVSRGKDFVNGRRLDFDHYYTTDQSKVNNAIGLGYKYYGVEGKCFSTKQNEDTAPLYELYNERILDHFYTTNPVEKDLAIKNSGYFDAGIPCYVYTRQVSKAVCPLYRLWIGRTQSNHFYTLSRSEKDAAVAGTAARGYAYTYEGIAGYLYPYNRNTCPD